ETLREGKDIAIVAYGSMVYPAVEAAESLKRKSIEATVVNARFVKPIDEEMILKLAEDVPLIVTVEEAYLAGGFGSAVMETLESHDMQDSVKVVRMGVDDEIVTHGDPKRLLAEYGLNAEGIAEKAAAAFKELDSSPVENRKLRAIK